MVVAAFDVSAQYQGCNACGRAGHQKQSGTIRRNETDREDKIYYNVFHMT
jgi:hypothetical protein